MKSYVFEASQQPLSLTSIRVKQPEPGEVLVRVAYSGINPIDLKIMSGRADYAKVRPGDTLGIDTSGTVEAVGEGVTDFNVGDHIYGMVGGVASIRGSLAEWVTCDARTVARMPSSVSFREAASLPLVSITAWEGLVDRGGVKAGDEVLIHGGAGGVGNLAIQLAKALGARVWATGSEKDRPYIESFGVNFIDYKNSKVEDYVQKCTHGLGFDIVFDTVGGKTLDDSFMAVKTYTGTVVSCVGWGNHSLATLSFRGASYSGVYTLIPLITGNGRSHHQNILREISKLTSAGLIAPCVHSRGFKFSEANEAYKFANLKRERGKIVIEID